jgi:predicted nucleotidyltransferase component of viral defense system
MIGLDELARVAEAKRLSLDNAETDYLLEMLLFALCGEVKVKLILKGGTALYKFFNLPRFSEDLDFTLNARRLDVESLFKGVLRTLATAGIDGRLTELSRYPRDITARLSLRGPLYDGSKESLVSITANISLREKPIKIIKEMFRPYYREIPAFDIWIMDAPELLAEKIRAVLTRRRARDTFDVWFLLKRGIKPDISLINRKLKIYKLKFSHAEFLRKIDGAASLWETDLHGLIIGELPAFEKIKAEIVKAFTRA